MDLQLQGRCALVTGASRGIGLACASVLAAEGCDVTLVARGRGELELAKHQIEASAPDVSVRVSSCDLASDDAIADLIARHDLPVDILVNNAGAIPSGALIDVDQAQWRSGWDAKVFGYIAMTRAVYSQMAARRRGVIINIIGMAGERLNAAYIAGSTGNAALMAFTRALGGASPSDGVRVVGVNPGFVATDRVSAFYRGQAKALFNDPDRWREALPDLPFGRAATPHEIAVMVGFLASDLSAYTTGTVVTIDGGLSQKG
jgi:NAD(P)-dependent dehydrogenase (short-subunit alcohol dehydrogenase family)